MGNLGWRWLRPAVWLLVGAAACGWAAGAPRVVASEAPAGEAAVREVVGKFVESLDTADLDAFSALFAPDATAFFPLAPVLGLLEGKAAIAKVFGIFFESVRKAGGGPPYMDLKPEGERIQLWGDTAVATFHFSSATMFSRRTLVLRRTGGSWRIVHMHASGLPIAER